MIVTGRVNKMENGLVHVSAPLQLPDGYRISAQCDIYLSDGRSITPDQRRKAWALLGDIANYNGDDGKALNEVLKAKFCMEQGVEHFSLANTDRTTAREYITFLINFCLEWDIPCYDSLLNRTDDIDRYLYLCLYHRKCCLCGRKADLHHVDTVGAGRDRRKIHHLGLLSEALCRKHHNEVGRIGQQSFDERYHIYGIKLDEILCRRLGVPA